MRLYSEIKTFSRKNALQRNNLTAFNLVAVAKQWKNTLKLKGQHMSSQTLKIPPILSIVLMSPPV